MEKVITLLSQDGGNRSPAAAAHLFTANPGGVRSSNLCMDLSRIPITHTHTHTLINSADACCLAGEKSC